MRHPSTLHCGDLEWAKLKILVFSQDEAFRFLVRSTFRKLSVKDVLSTAIADDAEHLVGHAPDIAVVDFDGDWQAALGFIARVRGAPRNPHPDMPILAAVKAADRDVVGPAFNMGIEGVVPKPVSGHELAIRVADTLRDPVGAARPPAAPEPPRPAPKPAPPPAPMSPSPPPPSSPPPSSPPEPAAAARAKAAAPRPAGASHHARSATPARPAGGAVEVPPQPSRPAGARLGAGDLAPPAQRPGGTLPDLDSTPAPVVAPSRPAAAGRAEGAVPTAPPQYALEHDHDGAAARRKAAKVKADWQAELARAGHAARSGSDVAGLDVSAIVAAHLAWLQSRGAEGSRATFKDLDLAGAALASTVLANATFREVDLSDASLAESRLDGADFRYAKLDAADLSGANLGVAQLRHAKCRLANLTGAVLRGADLSGADLRGAKLDGADFTGATMVSTDLRGTDLSKAENLSQGQVDKAVCDIKTKLPPGVMRPAKQERD